MQCLKKQVSVSNKVVRPKKFMKKVASVIELPDEITLHIFSYLDVQDLLIVAQVCRSWYILANDNSLWRPIFETYSPQNKDGEKKSAEKRDSKASSSLVNHSSQYLKTLCIKSCVEFRNKKAYRLVKKINPYTGLLQLKDVEKALMSVGVYWQLVMIDSSGNEHYLYSRDIAWHLMSVSIRWFDLEILSLRQIKQMKIFTCNPLFFDNLTGHIVQNGPYQRSLLQTYDIKWSAWVSTNKPIGSDDMINIYALPGGLSLAVWKDGGELAFICVSLHGENLVSRCLKGNSIEPYIPSVPKKMFDDVDSAFGPGYARFVLIKDGQRQILDKDLVFPWKTDAFKGKVKNVTWLDVTMTDEKNKVFWAVSSLVKVSSHSIQQSFDFEYADSCRNCIDYTDQTGKFHMGMDKTDDGDTYITDLVLMLSLDAINKRFGTSYS
ncbi:hypothetical protein KUTeg_019408 [Tegillarca granosa]|uniref:F-box domain-containing protein n=1 Tax=Tegillarca granosa TaxID=220873 RepID=A0ABQ9EHF4_TEGGR|nr:hypothetical protein KUTeg_019408 [Tegillarca granosa]